MLMLRPVTITEANAFIGKHHRHNRPVQGGLFAVGISDESEELRGVAVVGRPVARMLQDGYTCEVVRVGTDGARNGCSMLYGAATRAAKALGYRRAFTYTLAEETGASLRAAGWELDAEVPAATTWDRPSRRRIQTGLFGDDRRPVGAKIRWKKLLDSGTRSQPEARSD